MSATKKYTRREHDRAMALFRLARDGARMKIKATKDPESMGLLFRLIREAMGWTRPETSLQLGKAIDTIQRWERGDIPEQGIGYEVVRDFIDDYFDDVIKAACR